MLTDTGATYHLRIRPSRGIGLYNLREVWAFRGLLFALAMRDVKLRYRQTALGTSWVILQPLLASGILAFVFGTVAGLTKPGRGSVFIFVLAGFVGWSFFSAIFSRSSQSLIQHAALVSKIYFPRLILPLSAAGSALLDAAIVLVLYLVLAIASGAGLGWEIITLPIWLTGLFFFAIGFGLISSALSARFRDVQHIAPVLLQILLYATPVAYRATSVPETWRNLFYLNPLVPLLEGLRWSLLRDGLVPAGGVFYALGVGVFACILGLLLFNSTERELADVI